MPARSVPGNAFPVSPGLLRRSSVGPERARRGTESVGAVLLPVLSLLEHLLDLFSGF